MEDAPALLHIVPGKRMARRRETRHRKPVEPVFHDHHDAEIGGKRFDDLAEDHLFISLDVNLDDAFPETGLPQCCKPAIKPLACFPDHHIKRQMAGTVTELIAVLGGRLAVKLRVAVLDIGTAEIVGRHAQREHTILLAKADSMDLMFGSGQVHREIGLQDIHHQLVRLDTVDAREPAPHKGRGHADIRADIEKKITMCRGRFGDQRLDMRFVHAEQGRAMADDVVRLQIDIRIFRDHPTVQPLAVDIPELAEKGLPVPDTFKHRSRPYHAPGSRRTHQAKQICLQRRHQSATQGHSHSMVPGGFDVTS